MIDFFVDIEPKGKGRPRVGRIGSRPSVYTPKTTRDYEQAVRSQIKDQMSERGIKIFDRDVPIAISIKAFFKVPKSWTKRMQKLAIDGDISHTKKPDIDNVQKSILDAMNGVVFFDDAQVEKITALKKYGESGRIEIEIYERA